MATTPGPHPPSKTQNTIQTLDDDTCDVKRYLHEAIEAGSLLRSRHYRNVETTRVPRRALIVAPVYKGDDRLELPSTASDAMLIHKMLVQCGYEEQNIRIMCDYVKGFLGLATPTRENILASLEWFTSNTQSGDHRFFYFSGYGERIIQEQDTTQARCVHISDEPGHDSRLEVADRESERIRKQKISQMHFAYYNEAIVTRYRALRWGEPEDRCSKVMDYELNQYWSNLPAGSILTCIMDCRVGGRITRPPVKLRGVGCRGGGTASASTQEEELGVPLTPDHCDPAEAVPWDASDMSSPLTPLANTSKTRLSEDIPVQQRQTDQMQAKIFIWTGCHNRQSHDPHGSGALTRVFTDVFESDFAALSAGSVTYEALFHRISEELAAQHSVRIGPQLFQV